MKLIIHAFSEETFAFVCLSKQRRSAAKSTWFQGTEKMLHSNNSNNQKSRIGMILS